MKRIILIFSTILALTAYGQQDLMMYGLQDIPQSSYSNPANRHNGKSFIGLPAISSNYFSYSHNGFKYSDAISKQGDSLRLNFDNVLKELGENNFLSINTKIDLLSFGFSIGDKTQLIFNVTEVVAFRLNYPKDFFQFLIKGNTSFTDNTADFSGLAFNASHYREHGIGISRQVSEKLRIGIRAKYLYGMENIYSEKTEISLYSDPNTYEITAKADVAIRTSGIDSIASSELISNYTGGLDNTGFAGDIGIDYEISDRLSINASILDFGFINWNSNTKSYVNNGGEFTYSGIEIDVFSQSDTSETSFDKVLDSLEKAFNLEESEEGYKTSLPMRFYAGANYKLTERDMAGVLVQSQYFNKTLNPSITLSYSRKLTKWITLASSYSIINKSYNNLGLGFSIDPGNVQLYLVSDNILGAFQPQNSKYLQLRFGINFIFGREKSTEIRPSYRGVFKSKDEKDFIIDPMIPTDSINNPLDTNISKGDSLINPTDSINNPTLDSLETIEIIVPNDSTMAAPDSISTPNTESKKETLDAPIENKESSTVKAKDSKESSKDNTIKKEDENSEAESQDKNPNKEAKDEKKDKIVSPDKIEKNENNKSIEKVSIPNESGNIAKGILSTAIDSTVQSPDTMINSIDSLNTPTNDLFELFIDSLKSTPDSVNLMMEPIKDSIMNNIIEPKIDSLNAPIIKTDSTAVKP